jgi:diguanylate cyclase (GGDEF)-like protein/PAS domain S-box-containing protein
LITDQDAVWSILSISQQFSMNLLKLFSQRLRYNTEALAESLFISTVPDIIYRLDKDGRFAFLNPSIERLGYSGDELIGEHFSVLVTEEEAKKVSYESVMAQIRNGEISPTTQPKLFDERRGRDRKTRGLEVNLRVKDSTATVAHELLASVVGEVSCTGISRPDPESETYQYMGTIGIIRDITERKYFESQNREQKARIEAILNTAAEGIVVTDSDGVIESINHSAEDYFGFQEDEMCGRNICNFVQPDDCEDHANFLMPLFDTQQSSHERTGMRKDQSRFPLELSVSAVPLSDRSIFTLIIRDITERKKAEQIIYQQANYDALTNLPNRSLFIKELEATIGESIKSGRQMALLFMDLDRFKWVNDNLGHAAGDQLLKGVSKRLSETITKGTVARMGGDEFTAMIPDISGVEEVSSLAKSILEQLNTSFELEGRETYISGSLGIALFPQDAQELDELMKCADEAMYRSKKAGRNAYHFHTGESFIRPKRY